MPTRRTTADAEGVELPPRYQPVELLGRGGGGEVWAVRDRILDRALALKVLAAGAGDDELMALVREATALSGLEGLGVPQVVAFGTLRASQRRFMVRELAPGLALDKLLERDDLDVNKALAALAEASEKLTSLHRAGILHGDLKPANIVVDDEGHATLVDLGLAAPWREGGTRARGLTPRYAAPELLAGERLTVRAEVFALGATLRDLLERCGDRLTLAKRDALTNVAARATMDDPQTRFPSVDELASALRRAAALPSVAGEESDAWPVLGADAEASRLREAVRALGDGELMIVEGVEGAGRSTLVRRLAWTLGVEGESVALLETPERGKLTPELVDLELGALATIGAKSPIVIVDDADELEEEAIERLRDSLVSGSRVIAVAPLTWSPHLSTRTPFAFQPAALSDADATELVRRVAPSLAESVREHVITRAKGRPGRLRAILRAIARRPVVSSADVDTALAESGGSLAPRPIDPDALLRESESALDVGHLDYAEELLARIDEPKLRVAKALLEARLLLGRGNAKGALDKAASVANEKDLGPHARGLDVVRARAHLRNGENAEAAELAARVLATSDTDALAVEALCISGIALAYLGRDADGAQAVERACKLAPRFGERLEALAFGNRAILHQRAGDNAEARVAYERSLQAAEAARDAATVALTRLNLGALARNEGDLAGALAHLEAAVDMARRAGAQLALRGALFSLANLDLYLGRYARARASIESLAEDRAALPPISQAMLFGLEAELAARDGDPKEAAVLYERSAAAWREQGRPHDAAEAELERLLVLARGTNNTRALGPELERVEKGLGAAGFGEHEALANIARGVIAVAQRDEVRAQRALDRAVEEARKSGRREWEWLALDARARHASSLGNFATSKRDIDGALAILEETSARLPRDLREVFWDDPRRRTLREAIVATQLPHTATSPAGGPAPRMRLPRDEGATSLFATGVVAEDRLARILEVNRELAIEHDLGRLLSRITEHAIAIVGAERGFVVLTNDQGELETRSARDRKGDLESGPHGEFSRSVADQVVKSGEPVVAQRAGEDTRLASAVSVHRLHIQSIACVPIRGVLRTQDDTAATMSVRTIGALYLETRNRPGVRFQAELPTLLAFADQVAIAIENARLLAENRARAEALARTNEELRIAQEKLAGTLGRRTEQLAEARRDLREVRAQLGRHFGYGGLVGTSAAMRKIYALIERIKDAEVPVLITGESGTGKEVVAKTVHAAGPRAKAGFFGVNCGAIPENLLESELFGHARGAFTGADRDRKGLFREADGGTILLDEIGELPLKMQAGLLRVLQEKCVRPVGSAKEEPVDVRVLAATNRDLSQMVSEGTFREDLYYRLHVVELRVPPLRERVEDIPPLLDHFLGIFASRYRRERKAVGREALRRLMTYEWPGNVRQLEHVLLNAWLMSEDKEIAPQDFELPSVARERRSVAPPPSSVTTPASKEDFKSSEKNRILSALQACDWNRVQAARMLGLPRRTFYRRLKEYGIL